MADNVFDIVGRIMSKMDTGKEEKAKKQAPTRGTRNNNIDCGLVSKNSEKKGPEAKPVAGDGVRDHV